MQFATWLAWLEPKGRETGFEAEPGAIGDGEGESSLCPLCLLRFDLRSRVDSGIGGFDGKIRLVTSAATTT